MIHLSSRKKQKSKNPNMNTSSSGKKMILSNFGFTKNLIIEPTNIIWIGDINEINRLVSSTDSSVSMTNNEIIISKKSNIQIIISIPITNKIYTNFNFTCDLNGIIVELLYYGKHKNIPMSSSYVVKKENECIIESIYDNETPLVEKILNKDDSTFKLECFVSSQDIVLGTIDKNAAHTIFSKESKIFNICKFIITVNNNTTEDKYIKIDTPFIILS